jgi:hypothetical protein
MPITIDEIRISFLNNKLRWNEEIGVFIEVISDIVSRQSPKASFG